MGLNEAACERRSYARLLCTVAVIPFHGITASPASGRAAALLTDTLALSACFSGTRLCGERSRGPEGAGEGDAGAAASWTSEVHVPASQQLRRSTRLMSATANDVSAGQVRCVPLSGSHAAWTRMHVERVVPHVGVGAPAHIICFWDQVGGEQAQLLKFLLRQSASARVRCSAPDTDHPVRHFTLTPLTGRSVLAVHVPVRVSMLASATQPSILCAMQGGHADRRALVRRIFSTCQGA